MTEQTTLHLSVGEVIAGKYRVQQVLGQGGMGLVMSAVHEQLDQRVAIKLLLPAVAKDKEIVERFLREARAAVKIHSEHVARVHDVGEHDGVPYMVMEYLEGGDLARVIVEHGPLSPRDACGYVLEACDAIAEAHSLGIVHRDLKPANLFLASRPAGRSIVKVLDFGISKAPVGEKERALTNATAIMGSPSYMSPEQLVASASVDARSDIWSLGVVLYETLTGTLPFKADTMPELVGVILQSKPQPVRDVRPDLPPELASVIDRCLQKERENRFQSVAELARALLPFTSKRHEAIVEHIESLLGIAPPPSSIPPRTAPAASAPQASVPVENLTLSPTTAPLVRKRQPLWVIAPVVLVLGAIGGAIAWQKTHPATVMPAATIVATHDEPLPVVPTVPPTEHVAPRPSASATVVQTAPTTTHVGPRTHAAASASVALPVTSATAVGSASAGSGCHAVGYYDDKGIHHFKMECP